VEEIEEGLVFSHDARSLARMEMLNLSCPAGDFDLVFAPAAAPAGYDDLVQRSEAISVGRDRSGEGHPSPAGAPTVLASAPR
jgi:hypothetical protein